VLRIYIPSFRVGPAVGIVGEVADVELRLPAGAPPELRIDGGARVLFLQGTALSPAPSSSGWSGDRAVRLTADGVAATDRTVSLPGCLVTARDQRPTREIPRVSVAGRGRPVTLDARYGAGLSGLPFPSTPK
jgi:hypothetical protein